MKRLREKKLFQNEINELQILSNYIRQNPEQIQATGGNVSIKLDNNIMRIKASGQKITDINEPEGYIDVDYQDIIQSLYNKKYSDTKNLTQFKQPNHKVSIEVHFHAILKKVVLHTHPIHLNSILASKNASSIIKTLTGSKNYIPYVKPGFELGLEVFKLLDKNINKKKCLIYFLQNHGLIISADTASEVVAESKKIQSIVYNYLKKQKDEFKIESIRRMFNFKENFYISKNHELQKLISDNQYLTNYLATSPDVVIFCGPRPFNINPREIKNELQNYFETFSVYPKIYLYNKSVYFLAYSQKQADMIEDVFLSHIFVILYCPQNINFLSMTEILDLISRDDEKYRLKLTQ